MADKTPPIRQKKVLTVNSYECRLCVLFSRRWSDPAASVIAGSSSITTTTTAASFASAAAAAVDIRYTGASGTSTTSSIGAGHGVAVCNLFDPGGKQKRSHEQNRQQQQHQTQHQRTAKAVAVPVSPSDELTVVPCRKCAFGACVA